MKNFLFGFIATATLVAGFLLIGRTGDTVWASSVTRSHMVLVYLGAMFLLYPVVGLIISCHKRR